MKDTKKSIDELVRLCGTKKGSLIAGNILITMGAILNILPVLLSYKIIVSLITKKEARGNLISYAIYGVLAVFAAYLFTYIGSILCHTFSYRFIANLKKKIVSHIATLPLGYFTGEHKAKLKQVLSSDMNQIEGYYAHQLPSLVSTLLLILSLLFFMFRMNVVFALLTLTAIAVGLMIQVSIMVKIVKSGGLEENFKILDRINSATNEYVKGMPEVKIFGNSTSSFQNYENAVNQYRQFTETMTARIRPGFVAFRVVILSVATFLVPVGILLLTKKPNDMATMRTVLFFWIVAPAMSVPCLKLRDFAEGMNLLEDVVQRVWDVLVEKELAEGKYTEKLKNYDIIFEKVCFSYEKEQVLKDISFIAKQGELTALVGASGAGKSTIGALIPRFYEPTDGVIKLGGVNIQEMPSKSLMENISFVFQDNDLLSGTIFQNIAMAKKGCSKEEVIEAAKKARCHDFIMKLEKGYETILGKGNSLSGGEKQRIAVARAMLKDAPVLILDEATSYADSKNECLFQEALAELVKDKTVIMIAHRLGTIKNAQQILVLSEGQIVERGTHESLMKKEGVYRKMVSIFDEVRSWKMKQEGGLYHA
ncbi:ABC transporter ATP-binding protein [Oribacterium sp. oral taxon 108]|uniref:ABC transporter ATP-binding protein n=1 Tax=Oribacterium sp. oral taxon 108 TaxID=712414 RepID=UPI00020DD59F|nr:ABC transporter ATP-binding protein [Oribacterium sp. oral taxon 108]EGL37325.1 ABC transporter, ATP-binding protein [Oribacterium sp. oral taxon 108 str. F0425]